MKVNSFLCKAFKCSEFCFFFAVIVFGFDETELRVQEGAGSVSVGLVVFSPDPMLVSDGFAAAGFAYFTDIFTSDGSAIGKYV